jgi:hypothetical protein
MMSAVSLLRVLVVVEPATVSANDVGDARKALVTEGEVRGLFALLHSGIPRDHVAVNPEDGTFLYASYSAASKLGLVLPVLIQIARGHPSFDSLDTALREKAFQNLHEMLLTIDLFQVERPEYRGLLPWFEITSDARIWANTPKVPSLDNGILAFGLMSVLGSLQDVQRSPLEEDVFILAERILRRMDFMQFVGPTGIMSGEAIIGGDGRFDVHDTKYELTDLHEGILAVLLAALQSGDERAWSSLRTASVDYRLRRGSDVTVVHSWIGSMHEALPAFFLPEDSALLPLFRNLVYVHADHAVRTGIHGFRGTAYDPTAQYLQFGIPAIAISSGDRLDVSTSYATFMGVGLAGPDAWDWVYYVLSQPGTQHPRLGAVETVDLAGRTAMVFTADAKALALLSLAPVGKSVSAYLARRPAIGGAGTQLDHLHSLLRAKFDQVIFARGGQSIRMPAGSLPHPPTSRLRSSER